MKLLNPATIAPPKARSMPGSTGLLLALSGPFAKHVERHCGIEMLVFLKRRIFSWEHWMSPSNSNWSITHGSQSDFDSLRSTMELSGVRRTRYHVGQLGELCEGV